MVPRYKPYQDDFVGELRPSNRVARGRLKDIVCKIGAMRWSEGRSASVHQFDIVPNSYSVHTIGRNPEIARIRGKSYNNCGEHTNNAECIMYCNGGVNEMCIPLGRQRFPTGWGTDKNSRPSTVRSAWTTTFGSRGVNQRCHN